MADALQRFGIEGDLRSYQSFIEAMPLFHKAWRKLGLPKDLFPKAQPRFLFELIEERLDLLSYLGEPSPDADTFFKSIAGKRGGKIPAKGVIDATKLSTLSPKGKLNQTRYARKLRLSRGTLQRVMKGLPVSDKTVSDLCKHLKVSREEILAP